MNNLSIEYIFLFLIVSRKQYCFKILWNFEELLDELGLLIELYSLQSICLSINTDLKHKIIEINNIVITTFKYY